MTGVCGYEMKLTVEVIDMEKTGCLSAYENCDDSWVVTTEGPRGPKCTESARALIGRSARSGRVSTGALENTSAGALLKSTGTLKNTSAKALQESKAR